MTSTMKGHLIAVIVLAFVLQYCTCHIRLTYPPARKYEFDFLDNVRTPYPCGMPAGLGDRTNLQAGQTLDVHWHIAYPHKGGFYFELQNSTEHVIQRFPNGTGYAGVTDGTKLQYSIQLPDIPCNNCTLRMVRLAAEWSAGAGRDYLFWSCADVNIVPTLSPSDRCSGHGTMAESGCICEHLYQGDKCQFKEECLNDTDCSRRGLCINTEATSYPKHQCYCQAGHFGSQCQYVSSVSSKPSSMAQYQKSQPSNDVTIYYRIVEDEVEVVMKVQTASWVGLGWRAAGTDKICRDFPDLPNKYLPKGSAKEEGDAEGEGAAEGEGRPEGTAEGESHAKGNATAEGESHAEGNATAEGESHAKGNATAEGTSESAGTPEGSTPKGEVTAEGESHAEGNGTAAEEGSSEGKGHAEGEGEGQIKKVSAEGASAEGASAEGASAEGASPEGNSGLHAMDCMDIVIGSARGDYSRVGDYYTRDRSTPVHDEYLGGRNDLTAALAWEEGEYTNMLFRRKLTTTDRADHSLKDKLTHVIWAKGQKQGAYRHFPDSSLETKQASITDYYRPDELKYHGHGSVQRGAFTLNFYAAPTPPETGCTRGTCAARDCGYDLTWQYNPATDSVTFTITAEFVEPNQWIALGFSDDKLMPVTDVVYGVVRNGIFTIQDGWIGAEKKAPTPDASQDVTLVSGSYNNGVTTMTFTRRRSTGDANMDFQITDDNCPYLFYAKGGLASGVISKHWNTPVVSAQRVCMGMCVGRRFRTPVSLKITNENFNNELENKNSPTFQELKSRLTPLLETEMRSRIGAGFVSLEITGFRPGSIVVDFDVVTTSSRSESQVKSEVQTAAEGVRDAQALGQYQLDQNYLFVNDAELLKDEEEEQAQRQMLTEAEIIIIAVVVGLVVVAATIGLCKFVEVMRSRNRDKQRVMRELHSSSGSSDKNSTSKKNRTMTYGEFMATADGDVKPHSDVKMGFGDEKRPPPYGPVYVNPGYDSAGYEGVP